MNRKIPKGKKMRRNEQINKKLNADARESGLPLDQCELRLECCDNMFVAWAHSVPRWEWGDNEELWYEAARSCQKCHQTSSQHKDKGAKVIREAIAARPTFYEAP